MFLDCFQLGLGKPDFNTNFFKLSVDRPNTTQACEPGIFLNKGVFRHSFLAAVFGYNFDFDRPNFHISFRSYFFTQSKIPIQRKTNVS